MTRVLDTSTWVWTAAAVVAMAWLSASMPPQGFFSGDSGVKLVMARQVAARPSWPVQVDAPRIGGRPAPEYMDPFYVAHGDHAHPLQSALLPVLAAPLVAAVGLRGISVIPAAAFVVMVPLVAIAQRRLGLTRAPALAGAIAACASPLFFYGLEFWEHAPAAAALTAATALAWGRRRVELAAAGLSSAVAVLFRLEAAWYVAAMVLAMCVDRRVRAAALVAATAAAALSGPLAAEAAHAGSVLGTHWAVIVAGVGREWLAARAHIAEVWLRPGLLGGIGLAGVAAARIGNRLGWPAPVRVAGAAGAVLLALAAALGVPARESWWQGSAAIGLALLAPAHSPGVRSLFMMLAGTLAGVLLTAPNDGGAQWGPRFLLVAAPAVLLLAAESASALLSRRRAPYAAAVALVLLSGLAATRLAYRELRGSKQISARLVDGLDRARGDAPVIVTDLWWLDQLGAPLQGRVEFFVVASAAAAEALAARLEQAGVRELAIATSGTSAVLGPAASVLQRSCFVPGPATSLGVRDVVVSRAVCR